MHVIKNKTQKIVSICFFLISASLFTLVSYNLNSSLENYPSFKLDDTLKQADIPWSYNLTGDAGIYIDDSNPSYNWSTFLHFDWVTGNGTGGNPYEIKNILFDGEGRNMNIITIKNSIATFRIEECILYNTYGWDGDYNHGNAIYLENVVNGIISNVNTSGCTNGIRLVNCGPTNILRSFASNNRWGISLYNSHNNDIEYNRVFKNYLDGIEMDSSSSNTIAFNEIFENSNLNDYSGIKLYYSSHNNITNNKVNLNRFQAIIARYSSFNNILNNVISKNSQGIECYNSHFNTI